MTIWKIETISIVTLSGLFALALLLAVIFFAGIVDDHGTMIHYLRGTAERLERLENNKARATARRWTADDQMDFIACLNHPNFTQERRACINRIKAKFQAAQQP